MTPFERALRERVANEGPISLETYMQACNRHYYATRNPLGASGDFTTAPEISQMFGELVGACLADCWARAGRPADAIYVELGPGRGTLASDALRVLRSAGLEPEVHFLESSPALRDVQLDRHPNAEWHEDLLTLTPDRPLLMVANEFLDALPIRQFVDGVERRVLVAANGLAFDREGSIIEESPARLEVVSEVAKQLDVRGGVALIIDYGHERSAPGDTLQAVRQHKYAPVLANPGEQDLTSHVNFQAVAEAARSVGVGVTRMVTQGQWLERLGISKRAAALARAHPQRDAEIEASHRRLCDPAEMGELFKVISIHSPQWPQPAGFE